MRRELRRADASRRSGAGCTAAAGPAAVLLAGTLLLFPLAPDAHDDVEPEAILAPGYNDLAFQAPAPGSYALPPLGNAGGAELLDTAGNPIELDTLLGDKLVVLSFIYSSCDDVNGCPLATFVLRKLQKKLAGHPELNDAVRLVSISFDPVKDTPPVMAEYRSNFSGTGPDWHFLTARDEASLRPLLEHYGQYVQREIDADGATTGAFAHILRVYLVDRARQIRNIYSASFLHPDTLLNDLLTVNDEASAPAPAALVASGGSRLSGAGDFKQHYDSPDYVTRARSLESRVGREADLPAVARGAMRGLPPLRSENATAAQVALGRALFYDRRLSHNGTLSCAMCHIPEQGFSSNELATAIGIEGRSGRRNAPTLLNVAWQRRLFHDARETTLEQQVWSPLLAHNEMANPSVGYVVEKIAALPEYAGSFEAAFDGRGPGMETIGMALAAYERLLVAGDSPFDRWHYGGEPDALSPAAQRGLALFTGRAGCDACHTVGEEGALFTDHGLHSTGIGYAHSMGIVINDAATYIAPGEAIEIDAAVRAAAAPPPVNDLGRYEITEDPADRWKYRTPGLRNVALTAPYMHNGSLATLRQVVEFYNRGGVPHETLDPRIRPLGLSSAEIDDIVAFLRSLTGSSIDAIVADAFAAPVGNVTVSAAR